MLHKAAHSFSPFKLQHLHAHIRSALNLNIGQNAGQNFNQAAAGSSASASASSSSTLGSASTSAGGAGGAKYHAGRSYGHYYFNRTITPAANASSSNDNPSSQKNIQEEEEEGNSTTQSAIRQANRSLRYRTGRRFAGRQRSSSLSNPGLTTGLPLDASSSSQIPNEGDSASSSSSLTSQLPRSSPYSFNQAQLQARYRHAFSQAKRPSHERLITPHGERGQYQQQARGITTRASAEISIPTASLSELPKTAPSSPRLPTRSLTLAHSPRRQQIRRNSTSAVQQPPTIPQHEDVIKAASTLAEPAEKTISPEVPSSVSPVASEAQAQAPAQAQAQEQSSTSAEAAPVETAQAEETSPVESLTAGLSNEDHDFIRLIGQMQRMQEMPRIRSLIRSYRSNPIEWNANKHGALIRALNRLRNHADVYEELFELYNDFFEHDLGGLPHLVVQGYVIQAYSARSMLRYELLQKQTLLNNAMRLAPAAEYWSKGTPAPSSTSASEKQANAAMFEESALSALQKASDEDYESAKNIMKSLGSELKELHSAILDSFMRCAAIRGDVDFALITFGALEGNPRIETTRASYNTFKELITTYAKVGDSKGMYTVFETFVKGGRDIVARGGTERKTAADLLKKDSLSEEEVAAEDPSVSSSTLTSTASPVDVWNAAISGYLILNDGVKALEVLERMMSKKFYRAEPTDTTLLSLVNGFAQSGDLDSAFRWANRIHSTPTPEDLPSPPKISDTFNTIVATTADVQALQDAAGKTPLLPQLGQHVQELVSSSSSSLSESGTAGSATSVGGSPRSPALSSGATSDLGSIFSDPSLRSRTLPIKPPQYILDRPANDNEVTRPDYTFSHNIDEMLRARRDPAELYGIVKAEARNNDRHCHPETLARLALEIGLKGNKEMLEGIEKMVASSIQGLHSDEDKVAAWAYMEDRLLIVKAKTGRLEEAAQHRDKLLAAGAAPSADAYAAMITSAKDTTDDATVALELFEEARRFGVVPNLYLFNILISKLSKARRTQLALSYFEKMKAIGINPSAVSYGSVIAACCRTGDERAATFLFNEMVSAPGFKPRVPPYNTMMQFFIATKPDREKALSYFDAMLRAGVAPTGHTYKLLLDAYGSLEPVDLDSVKDVFARLLQDKTVTVTGSHWASLIHAYGTVQKDLDRTLEIFDSIASHPASGQSKIAMPDVICYEALFNAFVAMDRVDLLEKYLNRMKAQFVRPTAYISNVIIRAYSVGGKIDQAREAFNALSDPPSGVAAAGNHSAEKQKSSLSSSSESSELVYREPSTYEAMIKAEMTVGETERALELLEKAKARAFPPAIINKLERMTKGEDSGAPAFAPSVVRDVQ